MVITDPRQQDLPDQVLIIVLKNLPEYTRHNAVEMVCKRWQRLSCECEAQQIQHALQFHEVGLGHREPLSAELHASIHAYG